jgi:hypothetical protein
LALACALLYLLIYDLYISAVVLLDLSFLLGDPLKLESA